MEKKENQRIMLTKKLIQDALLKLLQSTELNCISIRQLCEKAGINRTTFYHHYGSQYDVLKEMSQNYVRDIEEAIQSAQAADCDAIQNAIEFVFQYMEDHLALSRILLNSNSDLDFPNELFSIPGIMELMVQYIPKEVDPQLKQSIILFAISGSYHLLREWINKDERLSAKEEARLVLHLAAKTLHVDSCDV